MCILFIAQDQHPDYPLIIAANRDEYFTRPSEPMRFWADHPNILAGRDLEAGGTWLGLNRTGAFAAVTNFRQFAKTPVNARSRGGLVVQFLDGTGINRDFITHLETEHQAYNPFNLVFGSLHQLYAWDHLGKRSRMLGNGFHSVSNGAIDQPWPKMARGVERLQHYVAQGDDIVDTDLIGIMQDRTKAPIDKLPNTGINPEQEQALSSIFIDGEHYGTRTTTILLFDGKKIHVTEKNYRPSDASTDCKEAIQRYTVDPGAAQPVA